MWIYLPLDAAMKAMGMEEVVTYVLRRQNTTAQYITTNPILEICMTAERRPGAWVPTRWWEKARLNLGQGEIGTDIEKEEEGKGEENSAEGEAE